MRWLRRRERTAPEGASLAPIRIFTRELELVGSVAPTGQRITDLLLRGQDLAFLPSGADPVPRNWVQVTPSDVLFVVPPPLAGARGSAESRSPAEARSTFPMAVTIGTYRINGAAHVQGDGARGRAALRPLTQATIRREDGAAEAVDVVIVNLGAAASAETPDAPT